jgi:anion-transporting  ArsA/GET3 family ATPase
MHILIMSGQSSVVQNATALATGCHAAKQGLRVLVVGTGPIGTLSALAGEELSYRPTELSPNLHAMELVTLEEFNQRWEMLCNDPKFGLSARLRDVQKDEIPSFPGMDEIASLIVADRAGASGKFDLVIFGGTTIDGLLRGFTMRETIRWLTRLVCGLSRGPGNSRASQEDALMPMSIINALGSTALMQDIRVALERYSLWFDSRIGTRVRLILPPEEMNMAYIRHVLNGFGLYHMEVDNIMVRGDVSQVSEDVQHAVGSLLMPSSIETSPVSIDEWAERGAALYQREQGLGLPPKSEQKIDIPPQAFEQSEVKLHIPLIDSKELDIGIASGEIVVRIGQFRRHLLISGIEEGGRLRAKVDGDILRLWVDTEAQ